MQRQSLDELLARKQFFTGERQFATCYASTEETRAATACLIEHLWSIPAIQETVGPKHRETANFMCWYASIQGQVYGFIGFSAADRLPPELKQLLIRHINQLNSSNHETGFQQPEFVFVGGDLSVINTLTENEGATSSQQAIFQALTCLTLLGHRIQSIGFETALLCPFDRSYRMPGPVEEKPRDEALYDFAMLLKAAVALKDSVDHRDIRGLLMSSLQTAHPFLSLRPSSPAAMFQLPLRPVSAPAEAARMSLS